MGRVGEVGMRGSQITCKFIEGIVPNEGAWGDIQHTVIRVEFLDGGAGRGGGGGGGGGPALRRVTLSKNFLKVTEQ